MSKSGSKRSRNGAFLITAGLLFSGVTGCSNGSPKNNTPVVDAAAIEAKQKAKYGPALKQIKLSEVPSPLYIDFSTAGLGVYEYHEEDYDKDYPNNLNKIIQIKFVDGKFRIKDISRDGMDPATLDWFRQAISARLPILEAAARAGTLYQIVIGLDTHDEPSEYSSVTPQNTIDGDYISTKAMLRIQLGHGLSNFDAQNFDRLLVHEATHALSEKISNDLASGKKVSPKVQRFIDACTVIKQYSDQELVEYNAYLLRPVILDLQYAADLTLDEREKQLFLDETEIIQRDYASLQPATEADWFGNDIYKGGYTKQYGGAAKGCATNSTIRMKGLLAQRTGRDIEYGEYGTGKSMVELMGEDAFNAGITASVTMDEVLATKTIYRSLTASEIFPNGHGGHGWDDAGEMVSGIAEVLMYPDTFALTIRYAPDDQRPLLEEQVAAFVEMMTEEFPELKPLLSACHQTFNAEINFSPQKESSCPAFDF